MGNGKVGVTELGLEDINYVQGDLRVHLTPDMLGSKLTLSVGVKHRQHPVYGFDQNGIWIQLGTEVNGGSLSENAFGIDDNMVYPDIMI